MQYSKTKKPLDIIHHDCSWLEIKWIHFFLPGVGKVKDSPLASLSGSDHYFEPTKTNINLGFR